MSITFDYSWRRWPDEYMQKPRNTDPNWAWLDLWDQENPRPGGEAYTKESFAAWWDERRKMSDRVWVAWCLPQFRVFDWSDEDVARAREITRRHVCSVCGAADDPGCVLGC